MNQNIWQNYLRPDECLRNTDVNNSFLACEFPFILHQREGGNLYTENNLQKKGAG